MFFRKIQKLYISHKKYSIKISTYDNIIIKSKEKSFKNQTT